MAVVCLASVATAVIDAQGALLVEDGHEAVVYALSPKGAGSKEFLRELADQTGGDAIEVESLRELSARVG